MLISKLKIRDGVRRGGWLLAELFIVIIGVYVAFLLNEWRASHAQKEARRQLYSALKEEIYDVDANIEEFLAGHGKCFSHFKQAYDKGSQPELEPVYFSIAFEPYLFKAATEGVGIELLNVPLMYDLAEFYNTLDWAFLQLTQLEAYSKDRLVAVLASTTENFYNDKGRLKEVWRWYYKYNKRLIELMRRLDMEADSLENKLGEHAKQLETEATAEPLTKSGISKPC